HFNRPVPRINVTNNLHFRRKMRGNPLRRPRRTRGSPEILAFIPDGNRLFGSGNRSSNCDAQTGQELLTLADSKTIHSQMAFNPDGHCVPPIPHRATPLTTLCTSLQKSEKGSA